MKKLSIIFLLGIFVFGVETSLAQSKQDKDRAAFIGNTKLLEKKPFDDNAPAAREWNFKWLTDTKDVTITVCSGTLKLIPEKKNKFHSELFLQFNFGMAVFSLQNPDKKDDEVAATVAGLESALRAYEVMVTENKKAQNPAMDELLAKRASNGLASYVETNTCKQDDKKKDEK